VADTENLLFQRKVSYDNIDPDALDKLGKVSTRKAQALLEQLDRQFASYDLPPADRSGVRVSLGIYYYEEESSKE